MYFVVSQILSDFKSKGWLILMKSANLKEIGIIWTFWDVQWWKRSLASSPVLLLIWSKAWYANVCARRTRVWGYGQWRHDVRVNGVLFFLVLAHFFPMKKSTTLSFLDAIINSIVCGRCKLKQNTIAKINEDIKYIYGEVLFEVKFSVVEYSIQIKI